MKKNIKNDKDKIAKLLAEINSILSDSSWCICVTLFNGHKYCGKLLKQEDTSKPYRVIIVLLDNNGQEIHIDLADVEQVSKCIK